MKKTLIALAVTAFAAASAQAVTIYDNEGTKLETDGSVRLMLDNVKEGENRAHSQLRNDGSRFGFTAKHNISDDFYALGRLEMRFYSHVDNKADGFGDPSIKWAYAGLGSKTFGQVSFGRQLTIGDEILVSGKDNSFGVVENTLTDWGSSVVRYDYTGVEGLKVGADYRFAETRKNGEVYNENSDEPQIKNGYGLGAIYELGVAEGQTLTFAAGYTRDNFKVDGAGRHRKDGLLFGVAYTINDLELGANVGTKLDNDRGEKERLNVFQVGAKYNITPSSAVYGNYAYLNTHEKDVDGDTTARGRVHKFMLGAEYKVHKNVLAFVEGKIERERTYNGSEWSKTKTAERAVGVGLRVLW